MTTSPARTRRGGIGSRGLAVLVLVVLALAVRLSLYSEISGDYSAFVGPWYDYISSHGGFAALRDNFSNYSPPYLYLLAAATYLPIPKLLAIKTISVVFDLLLGYFGYRIVALNHPGWIRPLAAAAALLLAPTVVLNSAGWGQSDSIYAAFCLGSMYYLLRRQPLWAAVFFAVAFSVKLQAVFFLPVALIILLVQRAPIRQLLGAALLIPLVFAGMLLPALAAGAPWSDVLGAYPLQIASAGSGSTTQAASTSYTFNAPNFFQWVPTGATTAWKYLGLALTAMAVTALGVVAWFRRRTASASVTGLLLLATTLLIAIPFLLPGMHDRYFYLADVFSIVACCCRPRFWPVAATVQLCSLLAYAPFLWHTSVLPLPVVAAGELLAVLASAAFFVRWPALDVGGPDAPTNQVWEPPTNGDSVSSVAPISS